MFLQCQSIKNKDFIFQDIKSTLVDSFLIEQVVGYKKGEKISINEKTLKKIIKKLERAKCKLTIHRKEDNQLYIEIIAPNNSFEILLENSNLEDKMKTIYNYVNRSEIFQNLGNNIDHIFNSYFAQKDTKLKILALDKGYKKIFHICDNKNSIKLIKLYSNTTDKSFLQHPFFLINPSTIKMKNFFLRNLENILFTGEVSEFTSKKFRESKEIIRDHLQSLGYLESEISYTIIQDKDGYLYINFLIEPGIKRKLKSLKIDRKSVV